MPVFAKTYLREIRTAPRGIKLFVGFYQGGEVILYPWGNISGGSSFEPTQLIYGRPGGRRPTELWRFTGPGPKNNISRMPAPESLEKSGALCCSNASS